MANPLWLSCLPVFKALQVFEASQKNDACSEDFREGMIKAFSQFEHRALSLGYSHGNINDSKYALAAWVDECVMHSTWKGKVHWMQHSLQLQFFGEHSAGEGFFLRLNQLRQQGVLEKEVIEIYVLCLSLGFQGIYRFKEASHRDTLLQQLDNQRVMLCGKPEWNLSAQAEKTENVRKKNRDISLGWLVCITVGIVFFIYLGYSVAMQFQLQHAVSRLTGAYAYVS